MPLIQDCYAISSFQPRSAISGTVHSGRGIMDSDHGQAFEDIQLLLFCIQLRNQGSDNGK
jgi:hypothetical protein